MANSQCSIVEMASRLDDIRAPPFQLGIQRAVCLSPFAQVLRVLTRFMQIGSDADATAFLRELDDGIRGEYGTRDIVDTVEYKGTLTSEFIM